MEIKVLEKRKYLLDEFNPALYGITDKDVIKEMGIAIAPYDTMELAKYDLLGGKEKLYKYFIDDEFAHIVINDLLGRIALADDLLTYEKPNLEEVKDILVYRPEV